MANFDALGQYPKDALFNVMAYALACCLINIAAYGALSLLASSRMDSVKKLNISNRASASTHACIMFSRTLYYWTQLNPNFAIYLKMTEYQELTNDLMVGYLVYDTLSEIFVMNSFDLPLLGHHVLGGASHVACRMVNSGVCSYYHMMVYVAELSTPFLHASWVLYTLGYTESLFFKALFGILLITFFFVRILWGPYLQYSLYMNRSEWFTTEAEAWLFAPNFLIVVFFNFINYYWGEALFRKALKGVSSSDEKGENAKKKAA